MSVEPIIGVAIGTFFVANRALWLYRYRRHRQAADRFEEQLKRMQRAWHGGSPYRAATERDADKVNQLAGASQAFEPALRGSGFTHVGDIVAEYDGAPISFVRTFVDAAQTTCAFVSIEPSAPLRGHISLTSYTATELYGTRPLRVPHAEPPSTHRQIAPADTAVDKLVELHRTFTPFEGDASFVRIADLSGLLAQLVVVHERTAAWRNAQPPDELLDGDLRRALGDHYERWGKAWARRIRSKGVPQATMRRPS